MASRHSMKFVALFLEGLQLRDGLKIFRATSSAFDLNQGFEIKAIAPYIKHNCCGAMFDKLLVVSTARDLTEKIEFAERSIQGKVQTMAIVSASQRNGKPGGAPRR